MNIFIIFSTHRYMRSHEAGTACSNGIPECLTAAVQQFSDWMKNPGNNSSPRRSQALHSIHNGNSEVEKLLIEAQKESRSPSRANSKESSAQGSPKSPHSPNNELQESRDPGTEWIWDWSSRPEANPPLEWKERFKRPATSVRNTRVMKTMFFSWENLPYIVCSSTIAFISGAAM
uniref:BCL2/adenovirus E1B 19 kDa protein-interacting protein 3 n=1 Tax=Magallana gigas TaxID=29159 RepID=K1RL95_MAGGI